MSTATAVRWTASPTARAARLCLGDQLAWWAWFWVAVLVVSAAIAVVSLHFDALEQSALDYLSPAARWFAFAMLIAVTAGAFGPYVAHGLTRRAFVRVVATVAAVIAVCSGVLWALGHAVEALVFRPQAWPTTVREHLYADGAQVGLVALETVLAVLAYAASGALVGATYYRGGAWWGTVSLPVTLLPLAAAQVLLSGGATLDAVELTVTAAAPLRALGALLAAALGLLAVHLVVRRAPVRRPTV